ncbi:MAG: hypothetical protein C4330_08245 [Chitinophagaceae bacterium]
MNYSNLSETLLGKDLIAVSIEEVKHLAEQYSYFAPAHFLYLHKLKLENNTAFDEQSVKAPLYHHNILALDRLLHPEKYESSISFEEEQEPIVSEEKGKTEIPQPVITKPEPVLNTSDLTFEPFHTVDYFASQGIKLSQEETKDSFGKQLKSFTEWLKTMKRLPVSQMVAQLDTNSEIKVKNLAEGSINEADIVTEAMAEVWIKQGNRQKAIDVYYKLSLLNPSKKPYFADLIEKLK